ncbi:MAG: hypothetical protein HY645_08130 [Acidobacteria bacterium]|nr:hypothetical protein [Acidobacteriota bacterium]
MSSSIKTSQPKTTALRPISPFRILHAGLTFYSDSKCEKEVPEARLLLLICEDPAETLREVEAVPARMAYEKGQIVNWLFDHHKTWGESWYRDPETGKILKAWTQSAEFVGEVFDTLSHDVNPSRETKEQPPK